MDTTKYSLSVILDTLKKDFDPDVEKHLIGLYLVGSRFVTKKNKFQTLWYCN